MSSRGVAVPDFAGAAVGVTTLAGAVVIGAVLGAKAGATLAAASAFTVAEAAGAEPAGSVVFAEGDSGASGCTVVGLGSWQAASEASVAKQRDQVKPETFDIVGVDDTVRHASRELKIRV